MHTATLVCRPSWFHGFAWQAFLLFGGALNNFLKTFLAWAERTKAFQVLRFEEACAHRKLKYYVIGDVAAALDHVDRVQTFGL